MNIEELTIADARQRLSEANEIAQALGQDRLGAIASAAMDEHAYPLGKAVIIRCVTHYYTGKIVRVTPGELVIVDAAWIADAGRWGQALVDGSVNEVEPYPDGEVIVSRGAVVDVAEWHSPLPREVK
jgi:hypothetical protein